MRRFLLETVVCAAVAMIATTARAADDPPQEAEASADATAAETAAVPEADAAAKAEDPKKKEAKKDDAAATAAALGGSNVLAVGGGSRPFWVSGAVSFRTPFINDKDPANDRSMNYALTGGFSLFEGAQIMARLTLMQRFVAQGGQLPEHLPQGTLDFSGFDETVDDSAFRLGNLGFAFMYFHTTELVLGEFSRDISLIYNGSLELPTSRDAQNQAFYLGLRGVTTARMNVVDNLYLNVTGLVTWRGHEFAERAGPLGLTLPRFALVGQLALEYLVTLPSGFGFLSLGADISGSETVSYPARDSHESPTADATYVRPGYGYDLYVSYVPLPFLSASLAWEQGGNVVRNGVVNTFFFHRDETRLAFTVTARY